MKRSLTAALELQMALLACGPQGDKLSGPEDNPGEGSVAMKLAIPQELQQTVARVEYTVSASGLETLSGTLPSAVNSSCCTITGIAPGPDRIFTLNAYDATGALSHTGSASANIEAGVTADVRIQLLPVSGSADIEGDLGDTPLFPKVLELIGTWKLEVGRTDDFE